MNRDRLWIIGGIALVVVIALGGYIVGVSPTLTQAAAISSQTAGIQASNTKVADQLGSLKQQFADIDTLKAKLDTLRASIPETAESSVFLNELAALASKNDVKITEVTVGSATLYAAPAAAVPAAGSTDDHEYEYADSDAHTVVVGRHHGAGYAGPRTHRGAHARTDRGLDDGLVEERTQFQRRCSTGQPAVLRVELLPGGGSDRGFDSTLTGDAFTLEGTSDVVTTTPLIPIPTPTPTPTATSTAIPTGTPTPTSTPTTGK